MTFKLIQWNCRGYYQHIERIQQIIAEIQPNILCIQETNFRPNHIPNLRLYESYNNNRNPIIRASGGVSTFISKKLHSEHLSINTTLEAVAVNVWCPSKITICNIYIPPDHDLHKNEITSILNQLPQPYIIVGDFNAHSKTWGSEKTFGKGKIIDEILTSSNATLLNTGKSTYLCPATGNLSNIDLSFSDPKTSPNLEWDVLESLYDSDHFPILITSQNKDEEVPFSHERWKLKSADWESYSTKIHEDIQSLQHTEDIDIMYSNFTKIIIDAAQLYVGSSSIKNNSKCIPWWTPACFTATKNSKKALNKYRKHKTEENYIHFKHMKAIARKTLKEAKRESWRAYVSSITQNTPATELWQKIKAMTGRRTESHIGAITNSSNEITTKNIEIADIIAKTISDRSSSQNYDEDFINNKNNSEEINSFFENYDKDNPINISITREELLHSISTTRQSAPGPDNIPFAFIQNLPPSAIDQLVDLYNHIWTKQSYPSIWRHAIVIPIHKQNLTKTDPSAYRPISLTCTMCKIFEKIVNKRLLWFLNKHQHINKYQMGFRQQYSTMDNLVHLQTEILDAFASKQELIAVFLDIKSAFDTTWRPGIMQKLKQWNIHGNMYAFIYNFLSKRTFRVRVNGILSEIHTLENGVPQGSVLSSTLFIIAINDIFSGISQPVSCTLYADDVVMYCRGKEQNTTCDILQAAISQLEHWSNNSGFNFSPSKTKVVRFTRKNNSPIPNTLKMKGSNLQVVQQYKYLGVIFDERLNWKQHIEHLKAGCMKRLNLLKSLSNFNWGAQEESILKVYRALIRSKLDYGCIIYSTANKNTLRSLNVIQNSAIRIAMGAFKSSPTECLHREAGEFPLWLRRKYLALNYAARISACPQNPLYHVINRNTYEHLYSLNPKTPLPLPQSIKPMTSSINFYNTIPISHPLSPPWTKHIPNIDTSLSTYKKTEHSKMYLLTKFHQAISNHSPDSIIYTDASKDRNGTGCAVVCDDTVKKYHLSSDCSIFSAELYAVLQAFKLASISPNNNITICTDSLSSILAINTLYSSNPLVNMIHGISTANNNQGKNIILMWVPSHIGIIGNEKADEAAKQAILDRTEVVNLQLHYDLTARFKKQILDLWQQHWATLKTKIHEVETTIKFTKLPSISRRSQIILRRLRIGHTRLTHGHLMKSENAPICQVCNTPITVKHLLLTCPQYQKQRTKHNLDSTLSEILQLKCDKACKLMNFLRDTNTYHCI